MNNKNLIVAFALSALVLFGWQWFVAMPQMRAEQAHQAALAHQEKAAAPAASGAPNPGLPAGGTTIHMTREAALKAEGARVAIDTPMLDGSIALKGAKLDDLRLKKYRETPDPKSPEIVLLAPKSTDYPYYAAFGWIGSSNAVPGDQTVWSQQGAGTLSPGHPVTLTWDNGHGLMFTRVIAIDDQYMFKVADSVANKSGAPVTLYPFAYVAREGVPKTTTSYILHLGFVGVADGSEVDAKYDDFKDPATPPKSFSSTGGWVGITDKYWMAAVIPPQNETYNGAYLGSDINPGTKAYQANYRLGARNVAPGAAATVTHNLFAGAKVVDILRSYEKNQGIVGFDKAVDWGWFWFITQPLFWLLDVFYKFIGNFGIAILMLTVTVKLLFFPLANTSFKSMSRMKKVQPEMERLKKLHADDPQKQQMAIMEMYKREKVNPLTGCLPMLIQIPVFFSLYKVLYVTIEMRQAPFYGWIHDLSAPDPTSIINLFGLLPFDPHAVLPGFLAILSIGIWPILMGMTQFVQTKLNPAPSDPVQAKMFTLMPVIFAFMFATFPAGLVIYYTWNNLLTIAQQWFIMHKEGVEIDLFENLKFGAGTKAKKSAYAAGEFARKLFAGPCDFIWGASRIDNLPPQSLPEVAFVGRSNVGKSSLINALTGRKTVARVSQTPGRTREINFFNLGGKLMLVDLPGYGYAKASRELAQEWQTLAFSYMSGRATLTRTLVLIDARRGIMRSDLAVMELLDRAAVSYELVLTKTDEQKPGQIETVCSQVAAEARKHTAALAEIAATSAQTGAGIDALRAQLAALSSGFASERRV